MRTFVVGIVLLVLATPLGWGQSIEEVTAGMAAEKSFVTAYEDAEGRLLLEIDQLDEDFLYLTSLATGSGIDGPLLDRAQVADEYIGRFLRRGNRIYFELQNPQFTSTDATNPALLKSVEESFARSVIASFEVLAQDEGRYLVDATEYFTGDVLNLQDRLSGEGSYSLSRDQSYIHSVAAFPENTEIQAAVTMSASDPSGTMRQSAPDGRHVTHRVNHSIVELPDDAYEPREFDPRLGYFTVDRYDFSRGFDEDYVQRFASRHRLRKQNPEAEVSEPVEPIVYYVDPAIPEPYRQAFFDGFEWFEALFEYAGFENAFEIRDMPADMDPRDARYNTVVWMHRSAPGPSVGPSFRDPRTGEIIKGMVRMDSYRSLANFSMYQAYKPALAEDVDPEEFVMARRRQHAAHEIGHTLGLMHNFITESYGRASVMDYPAPRLRLTDDGLIDLSEAYSPAPGIYDSLAIRWGYAVFSEGKEEAGLQDIIDEIVERDIEYITHPWHGSSSSHPQASVWALNEDPLSEFEEKLQIRQVLMDHFDESVLQDGEPLWRMNERFSHVYFHHRFSLDALAKYPGGYRFQYSIKGDGRGAGEIIDADEQWQALKHLMDALEPEHLSIPNHIAENMAPRPQGYDNHDRAIQSAGDPAFDQLSPPRTLAALVFDRLFAPERVARIVAFSDRDPDMPALEEMVDYTVERVWKRDGGDHPALDVVAQRALMLALMDVTRDEDMVYEGQAAAEYGLSRINSIVGTASPDDPRLASHYHRTVRELERFFRDGEVPEQPGSVSPAPSGTPLGSW